MHFTTTITDEQCPSLNRVSLYPGFIVLCSQASFKAFSLLHCQSLGSVMMWYVGSRFDWAISLGARLGWQVKHWRGNVTHFSPHVKCPCCDKNLGNYGKLRWLYLSLLELWTKSYSVTIEIKPLGQNSCKCYISISMEFTERNLEFLHILFFFFSFAASRSKRVKQTICTVKISNNLHGWHIKINKKVK